MQLSIADRDETPLQAHDHNTRDSSNNSCAIICCRRVALPVAINCYPAGCARVAGSHACGRDSHHAETTRMQQELVMKRITILFDVSHEAGKHLINGQGQTVLCLHKLHCCRNTRPIVSHVSAACNAQWRAAVEYPSACALTARITA